MKSAAQRNQNLYSSSSCTWIWTRQENDSRFLLLQFARAPFDDTHACRCNVHVPCIFLKLSHALYSDQNNDNDNISLPSNEYRLNTLKSNIDENKNGSFRALSNDMLLRQVCSFLAVGRFDNAVKSHHKLRFMHMGTASVMSFGQ